MIARLLVCALFLGPLCAMARAQDAPSERDEEARHLFEAGRAAFANGRYEEARDQFVRSHDLSGRPALLYNIGTAEDRLRNDGAALAAFEAYLAALPDAENATEVRARVEVLRASVASADAAPASSRGGPTRETGARVPIAAIVTAALALAVGGAAIGTWVAANDTYGARERGCGVAGCSDAELGEVQTLVDATNVLWISALVIGAGAGVALAFELGMPSDETEVRASIGLGGLSIEGTF